MHSEQAAPDLLQKSLDASGVGWWQLDFGQCPVLKKVYSD